MSTHDSFLRSFAALGAFMFSAVACSASEQSESGDVAQPDLIDEHSRGWNHEAGSDSDIGSTPQALTLGSGSTLEDIRVEDVTTPLVPNDLLQGDREFDGHGPMVDSSVEVFVTPDQQSLSAHVIFHATETQPDHSTVRGEWDRIIYTAPADRRIVAFEGPSNGSGTSRSDVSFLSEPAGLQIFGPGEDFLEFAQTIAEVAGLLVGTFGSSAGLSSADVESARQIADAVRHGGSVLELGGNHVHLREPSNGGPVAMFAIVGDTGGDDISDDDNPKDDTRIQSITFRPLRVTLAPR